MNQPRRRAQILVAGMMLVSLLSFVLACAMGSLALSVSELWHAGFELISGTPQSLAASVLDLRYTRALSGYVTGATLALAGVLMQALLRNPLADPYVLGISSGASVAALATIFFFGAGILVDVAAFGGALGVAALLFLLAYRDLRGVGSADGGAPLLLLTGVIVAAGCSALITLLLSLAPDNTLRGMVFWLIGDLSNAQSRVFPWIILLGVVLLVMINARAINVSAMHADNALSLGVRVGVLRRILFVCAALLTASAVSTAGSVGFVGLIIPHACRFAFGFDHRLLIPVATMAGGSFLVIADALARTVLAPHQLPVGVITALIGVPVFLWQLHRLHKTGGVR